MAAKTVSLPKPSLAAHSHSMQTIIVFHGLRCVSRIGQPLQSSAQAGARKIFRAAEHGKDKGEKMEKTRRFSPGRRWSPHPWKCSINDWMWHSVLKSPWWDGVWWQVGLSNLGEFFSNLNGSVTTEVRNFIGRILNGSCIKSWKLIEVHVGWGKVTHNQVFHREGWQEVWEQFQPGIWKIWQQCWWECLVWRRWRCWTSGCELGWVVG